MHIIALLLCLMMLTGCAVGWGKPSEVRSTPIADKQYQITVDGDPWLTTIGKMTDKFHTQARAICPNYEIVSMNQKPGYGGVYGFSLMNITGVIRCKGSEEKVKFHVVNPQEQVILPVVGFFEEYNEVFKGQVDSNLKLGTGYIKGETQVTKTRCSGNSRITNRTTSNTCDGTRGIAELRCDDGRILQTDFVLSACTQGKGSGYDQKGNKFHFEFGMTEAEAQQYIQEQLKIASKKTDLPPVYEPKETRKEKKFSTGTGFFVSTDGYLITSYHVIKNSKKVIAVTFDKKELEAEVIKVDPANDVALLNVKTTTKPLHFSDQINLSKGEEVFTLGYPLLMIQGQEQKATFGRINSLSGVGDDVRFIQIDVPIQPGNSGSPLINMNGQVIGIIQGLLDQLLTLKASGSLPQNVNYALKLDYAIPLFRHYLSEKPVKQIISGESKKITDLIKLAESSVVLIIAK